MTGEFSPVNWLFLGELIVVVIATSAFLFYWNRLLGGAVGALIRLATWRWYNAYISIGSLQISPLAGRIAFRDFEYHSSNISFRAVHGNLTFRFWKVRVRQEGDSQSTNQKRARLPCRIILYIEGAEAFFYNRTPAYDAIVERLKKREAKQREAEARGEKLSPSESASTSRAGAQGASRLRRRPQSAHGDSEYSTKPSSNDDTYPPKQSTDTDNINITTPVEYGVSWFQEAMPMEIKIMTGSVVLGSDATPMVLIADFKRADGVVDVSEPRSHCDYYKLSVNLGLQDVTVLMRTNPDHSGPLLTHGKRAYDEILAKAPDAAKEPPSEMTSRAGFRSLAKRIPSLFNPGLSSQPAVSGLPNDRVWKGLARYRLDDEGTAAQAHKVDRQYAKVTTILRTRMLDLCYSSDSPGPVPEPGEARDIDLNDTIGNVEPSPEYSVDLVIHGGAINYGPWADRERDALQKAFIPQSFFDTQPRAKLKPGETRLHATLVVNVTMTDKTTLRIPTREPSKDWMFEGKKIDSERRYGWLDVVVGAHSSICFTQSQVPGQYGYDSMLVLHLDSLDIASSVNLESFVVAKTCKFSLTMPTPLVWNAQRNWGLDLTLDTPDIRLMREHVTLISDLSRDWSSGATGDFHHFVPVHYSFRVSLVRYAIHLFINDFNIVDAPRSRDANAFCDLSGPRLDAYVAVASTRYRPEFSIVPFTIEATDARVELSLPSWDTHRTFGKSPLEVGKIGTIGISGSYRYYATPKPDHQEKLKLHIEAQRVAFIALGWAIRRLFCVKDNYFGSFTQFSTMQEFLEKFDHSPDSVGDPVMEKYRPGRSDSFAVHLTVDVVDSLVFMSDQIYGCDQGIAIPVEQLQIDLKTNEFQMDMTMDAAPTYAIRCPSIADSYKDMVAPLARSQDVVFVEGIFIKANRLFGPQPRATTYFCLWELSFARVSAFLSPEFNTTLAAVGAAVGYNFADRDNAPASIYIAETPPDATFVKLSVNHVTAVLTSGQSGLDGIAVELPKGLFVDTSSMASQACRSVLGFGIPTIQAHVLHRRSPNKRWEPVGSFGTGVSVDIYRIPEDWQTEAQEQHTFLQEQDKPTRRVPYLYGESDGPWLGRHVNQIYLPRPRPGDVTWRDNSSVYTSGSRLHELGTSSPDRSDDSRPSIPLSRMSRRPRSKSVAQPVAVSDDNSIGDESDSVSSMSTSSSHSSGSSAEKLVDMCSILEDRLQSFQRIHQRAQKMFTHTRAVAPITDGDRKMPYIPLSINNGTIFRVSLEPTTVEIGPQTVYSVHTLVGCIRETTPSPEILLDQLLTDQVSAVRKKNAKPSASLVEVGLPSVDVRLVLGPFNHAADLIQLSLQGTKARIVNNPQAPTKSQTPAETASSTEVETGVTDVSISVKELRAVGGRNEKPSAAVSLHDVLSINLEPRYKCIIPFAYVSGEDADVTFHKTDKETTVQAKVGDMSAHAATPGLPTIAYLMDEWMKVFKSLPKHPADHALADLIYDILVKCAQKPDIPLPAFAHEGSYGLHVEDQRSIRRDPGWFTLARLRQWMRATKDETVTQPRPPPPEMARMVVTELARIDAPVGVTEDLVVAQPFLHKTFGKELRTAGLTPNPHASKAVGVFVSVDTLAVRHYGRLLETGTITHSSIILGALTLSTRKDVGWEDGRPVTDVRTVATLQKLTVDLRNSFISGIQAVLTHLDTHRKEIAELPVVQTLDHASTIVTDVHLGQVNIGITAGGLCLELSLDSGQGAATISRSQRTDQLKSPHHQEHNNALLSCRAFNAVLREASSTNPAEEAPTQTDRALIVATLRGLQGSVDKSFDSNNRKGGTTRLLLGIDMFDFDSRPQLKAFYDFARSWRDDHYHLYLPTLEQAKAVIARKKTPTSTPAVSVKFAPRIPQQVMVDLRINRVQLQARVAKGLWLGWEMGQVYATRYGIEDQTQFGLRVEPQTVGAYTTAKRVKTKDSSVIRLPSINATGSYRKIRRRSSVTAMVQLGLFTGIIKPAVIDRLLLVHQKIGNDVVEVMKEFNAYNDSKEASSLSAPPKPKSEPPLFNLTASFAGIRLGLRADDVPATLMFEALNLHASVGNGDGSSLQWSVKATHVGLSLIRMTDDPSYQSTAPARGARSVSMTCDISAKEEPGTRNTPAKVSVTIAKVHAVMHLAALSEVSDLIRSWTSDITVLREVHREEMDEVKEQTSKVLKKLDASRAAKTSSAASGGSGTVTPASELHVVTDPTGAVAIEHWFASRLLTFELEGLGVAIPLNTTSTIDVGKHTSGPALLYSIRLVSLVTSRNETARFHVQQTYLQFVDAFDPRDDSHFVGTNHYKATNRMMLPTINAEGQMTSKKESWSVNAHCTATDFKLTLTPDIADRVARLADMYEDGRAQLSALQSEYLAEWMKSDESSEALTTKYEKSPAMTAPGKQVIVRMSFRFDSGLVQLHRSPPPVKPEDKDKDSDKDKDKDKDPKDKDLKDKDPKDPKDKSGKSRPTTHDNIVLPTVSVWMDYTGPGVDDSNVGTLLFNMAVHESRNTLRPTILPFFVDLVGRVEARSKTRPAAPPPSPKPSPKVSRVASPKVSPRIATRALPDSPSVSMFTERAVERIAESPTGKLRLRITLRIDRSELRLSCAPDSNAYIDLKWASGGFSVSALLGGKDTTSLAGSVSGVTAYLSHEFADKDRACVTAGAKDMAFAVTLCSEQQSSRGLSVVVDTEVAVQFRLEAFSAWLIFMSVWVDNAPKISALRAETAAPASPVASPTVVPHTPQAPAIVVAPPARRQDKLGVAVLVRFRSIDFDANISVTQARLQLTPISIRTVSDGEKTEIEATITRTQITAEGDISGDIRSDNLKFTTIRRSSRATDAADPTVLSLAIEGGDLRGNMFINQLNIVRFHLAPSKVTLQDNWRAYAAHDTDAHVALDFIVNAGKFSGVLRLPAIPRLLGHFYSIFDLVESQNKIAMQRSETFKHRQKRNVTEMTPMTTVVLPTAQSLTGPSARPSHIKTAQRMRFEIVGLDIGIFADDYDDGTIADFYRFHIGKVEADLKRREERPSGLPLRDLLLHVSFVAWQTADGRRASKIEKDQHDLTPTALITASMKNGHRDVVTLPSMTLTMVSTEAKDPPTLFYDFDVVWGETNGDVMILPNFFDAAYKSFKKCMSGIEDQELKRARRRGIIAARRKKDAPQPEAPQTLEKLAYIRRGTGPWKNPIPRLRALGETTGDAAMLIPKIRNSIGNLPTWSHRFVTLPLEDGMDLLLKLYERQMPDLHEDKAAAIA